VAHPATAAGPASVRLLPHALLFAAGAVVLTLCDRVHVVYGVLVPEDTSLWGQSWWVPPLFGVAALSVAFTYPPLRRALGEEPRARSVAGLVAASVALIAVYVSTGPFSDEPWLLTVGLTTVWAARAVLRGSRTETVAALLLAVAGPAVEATNSALGLFHYVAPHLAGVPAWLPAIYMNAAPLAAEIEPWLVPPARR
jgi:hypothetical protein